MRNKLRLIFAASSVALTVACGGGGGSVPIPAAKAPTVSISLSAAKVAVNKPVTVAWASTDASSCVGADALPATQPINGSASVTQAFGGQFTYTITCTGAGGSATAKVTGIVPIPVQATSYLNAKNINIPSQKYPSFSQLDHTADHNDNLGAGVAFADFFQEGKISMVWFTNRGAYPGPGNPPGTIKFFKFDSDGNPIEYTSTVLTDTTGCSSPRKLLVADFNGDGRPDIFASCHGVEYGTPWPGEHPRVLLSQPDGTYKNVEIALNCYCHGAAAADINGDGFVDVLTSDERVNMPGSNVESDITSMVALINDGHGNFTVNRNYTNIITTIAALDPSVPGGVSNWFAKTSSFSMELVDVDGDGQPDLIFGTSDDLHFPSRVFINKNGRFDEITTSIRTGIPGFWAIDILVKDKNIYLYGVANYNTTYDYVAVYKYNLTTGIGGIIYNSNGKQWPNGNSPQDLIWIMPYNGYIVPYSAAYDGVKVQM